MKMKDDALFKGDFGAALPVELKQVTEEGEFEGYGSIFDNVDNGGDTIKPGAFLESLRLWPPTKVKMLYNHNPYEPIGMWTEMREDDRGLFCKGKLELEVQKGKEVHSFMKSGVLEGLSIGYRTKEYQMDREEGTRVLTKVHLREVSVVTFPMNELAGVTLVKSTGDLPSEREFERYLTRDAGFTVQQAKAIIADGYKSLVNVRDAEDDDDDGNELASLLMQAAQRMRG